MDILIKIWKGTQLNLADDEIEYCFAKTDNIDIEDDNISDSESETDLVYSVFIIIINSEYNEADYNLINDTIEDEIHNYQSITRVYLSLIHI